VVTSGDGGEEGQHRVGGWEVKLLGVRQVQGCLHSAALGA